MDPELDFFLELEREEQRKNEEIWYEIHELKKMVKKLQQEIIIIHKRIHQSSVRKRLKPCA